MNTNWHPYSIGYYSINQLTQKKKQAEQSLWYSTDQQGSPQCFSLGNIPDGLTATFLVAVNTENTASVKLICHMLAQHTHEFL